MAPNPSGPAPSPYEVLGVHQSATQAEIRTAYQEALRARTHSRPQVTQAFNQLRNPQNRLAADLLEPPPEPVPAPEPARRAFVDAASAPLPGWTSLIAPGAAATATREIGEPPDGFRPPRLDGPSAAVLPPTEFPL